MLEGVSNLLRRKIQQLGLRKIDRKHQLEDLLVVFILFLNW
jgi:hypothetical protein